MTAIMTRLLGIVLALAVLGAPSWPAKDEAVASVWAAAPVKVDGAADDWAGAALSTWKKGSVDFAFRNDAGSLYVLLVFKDPKYRSNMETTGITLYVNTEGKERKDYAILFQKKKVTADQAIALLEKQAPLTEEQKAQYRANPQYNIYHHEVLSKKAEPGAAAAGSLKPAVFKYAAQGQAFVYEFAIPMERPQEAAAGLASAPGSTVTLGFEWGGPTDAQRKAAARAAGGAGIANETMDGRGGIEAMGSEQGRLPAKYVFWTPVKLAAGQVS